MRPGAAAAPQGRRARPAAPEVVECHRITGEDCYLIKAHVRSRDAPRGGDRPARGVRVRRRRRSSSPRRSRPAGSRWTSPARALGSPRLDRPDLVDRGPAGREAQPRRAEVELPDPGALARRRSGPPRRSGPRSARSSGGASPRNRPARPSTWLVDEPGALERELDPRERQRHPVREHEPLGERALVRGVEVLELGDPVVEQPPAGAQQPGERRRRGRSAPRPRARPSRCSTIASNGSLGDLPVVGDPDLDAVADPGRLARARGPARACGSDRVTPRTCAPWRRGGVDREAAPAAADVEHPLAGPQAELVQTSSSLASCASSSVRAPREKSAQL